MNAFVLILCAAAGAAGNKTPNFVVNAPDSELACEVALAAEQLREALAIEWLGRTLPKWSTPCRISVSVEESNGGGNTKFVFERGEVYGWEMKLTGTRETILADHLPHEILHTLLASQFRRPLDQWVSEGLAQTVESAPVRAAKLQRVRQAVSAQEHIPLRKLIRGEIAGRSAALRQAQSLSVVAYLLHLRGRAELISCVGDVAEDDWRAAIREHYEIQNLKQLESDWLAWINGTAASDAEPRSSANCQQPTGEREVLFFMADWCGPCQKMLPVVQRLKREGHTIRRVDVDELRDLARRYEVTSIPVCLVIEDSTEHARLTGVVAEDELRKLLVDRQ